MRHRRLRLVSLALALAVACRPASPPESPAPTFEDLPAPSWRVVARRAGKVLLAPQRTPARATRTRTDGGRAPSQPAPEHPTLVFENGRLRDGPTARATPRILAAGDWRDTLRLYSLHFEARPVLFAQPGDIPVPPIESPAEPGLYVVEHDDRLWLLTDSVTSQLSADTARGIARDTLRAQAREGGPHLTWATRPVWRPDGSAIAYVTNRTWMLARPSGQEIWLAELRPRRERPVLSERGEFFYPDGWLGSELVYKAREDGIFAVDVRTGARRAVAPGSAEDFSSVGPRLLYVTAAGDTVRGHVLTERGIVDIPLPPPGERLDFGGAFSPSGERVLLGTSFARDSGITRALYVFDLGAVRLTRLAQWSFREGNTHPQGLPVWLDDSTLLLTRLDRTTGLESSTLVRLPRLVSKSP